MEKGKKLKIPDDGKKYFIMETTIERYGASFKGFPLDPNDTITYEGSQMSFGSDGMPEDIYCITKNGKRHCGSINRK